LLVNIKLKGIRLKTIKKNLDILSKENYKIGSSVEKLIRVIQGLNIHVDLQDILEFIYIVKAWQNLSNENSIANELSFESFYNQKIDSKKLSSIFDKLSKEYKLFKLYRFDTKVFDNDTLIDLLRAINSIDKLPSVNEVFYFNKGKNAGFSVSSQVAQLGIKLLDCNSNEIYIPFTNGFAYVEHTDKTIYADFIASKSDLYAELINILEDKRLIFSKTDALTSPTFTNSDAPHLLKEFDCVLSFPPFRLRGKIDNDKYNRFKIHKGTVLDVAHFEHILAQTKHRAVVLKYSGFAFSSGVEETFRKYLISQNYLEAIVQLPPNLHSATAIETLFFVINKQKSNDKVQFINLKDERFITRDGRALILKDIDNIIEIYKSKKDIENISVIVSNEDIANNNYSLAIDRYVVPQEVKELQTILSNYQTIKLQDIAQIRRSQLLKDEGDGKEVYELSPSDFAKAGFTTVGGKLKKIGTQSNKYETYKLKPYDVLLSTKGTIGKIAIIGEIYEPLVASQASQVIRVEDKNKAIELYMFLKSDIGQAMLKQLVAGSAMPQISTNEIKQLGIPILSNDEKKQVLLNFNGEIKLYNEVNKLNKDIKQIHNNFLGNK